ncbi:TPA: lytic transglycosylase [bacterium]|nr:MAG: hypothetical protein AUJ18_08270 [Candidatus Hydrogenedentes bacterium CG1_02_42_14]PIU48287.1 MAG: lytic transglycosylase [Candidatus Hydrogenedentes bacterium CG07_land_8_20_14_0_80_42_17]HBW46594.1 lytic transglycosylase [bacterium]
MKKIFLLVIILIFGITLYVAKDRLVKSIYKIAYERCYYAQIRRSGLETGVDPLLLTAVAYTESKFRASAVSPSGAIGIMQLMPQTAFHIAAKNGINLKDTSDLFIPEMNIQISAYYLKSLITDFHDTKLAIAAYNGGPSSIREWLKGEKGSDSDIAFFHKDETRRYVENVLKVEERLQRAKRIWRWIREI